MEEKKCHLLSKFLGVMTDERKNHWSTGLFLIICSAQYTYLKIVKNIIFYFCIFCGKIKLSNNEEAIPMKHETSVSAVSSAAETGKGCLS